MKTTKTNKPLSYASSGVNIKEGAKLVDLIKPLAKSTARAGSMGSLGGFGGLFSANFKAMKSPILISSTDGVGTKLKLAFMANVHDTVGIDLVAMCVNDIIVSGAEPLFFLDYFATGKLSSKQGYDVIKGITKGCKDSNCALLGGETAEMPGFYKPKEYDLAGFTVGVVDKSKIIDGSKIKAGHIIIGLSSSGLHSNGFSLARLALLDKGKLKLGSTPKGFKKKLSNILLTPTRIYVKSLLALIKKVPVKGMAHITGGGLTENIPRVLPIGLSAEITEGSWKVPPIFKLIQEKGNIKNKEMLKTFNMGIGMVVIVAKKDLDSTMSNLKKQKEKAFVIGQIKKSTTKISSVIYK